MQNWKRRWFVLSGDTLFYYTDEAAAAPSGVVPLTKQCGVKRAEELRPNMFVLSTPARKYHIVADSAEDVQAWLGALGRAIVKPSTADYHDIDTEEELS